MLHTRVCAPRLLRRFHRLWWPRAAMTTGWKGYVIGPAFCISGLGLAYPAPLPMCEAVLSEAACLLEREGHEDSGMVRDPGGRSDQARELVECQ